MNKNKISEELLKIAALTVSDEVDEWQTKFDYHLVDKVKAEYRKLDLIYRHMGNAKFESYDEKNKHDKALKMFYRVLGEMVTLSARIQEVSNSFYIKATLSNKVRVSYDEAWRLNDSIDFLKKSRKAFEKIYSKLRRSKDPVLKNSTKTLSKALNSFEVVIDGLTDVQEMLN